MHPPSLPLPQFNHDIDKRYAHYDDAHMAFNDDDCSKKFSNCPHSIWETQFMQEYF